MSMLKSLALAALLVSCLVDVTVGECWFSDRPFPADLLCSGNGICSNDECLCNVGYGGLGVFTDRTGHDCNVHTLGFLAMNCLAYGVAFITLLFALYRLCTLGRLRVRLLFGIPDNSAASIRGVQREAARATIQRIVLTVIVLAACTFAHYTLVIFFNLYVHNSLASCILFILCGYCVLFYAWQRLRQTISSVILIFSAEYKDHEGFRQKLEWGLGISSIICCLIQTAMLLGIYLTPDQQIKLQWVYSYYATFLALGITVIVFILLYYRKLLVALQEHIKAAKTLRRSKRPGDSNIENRTNDSLGKLRRLIIAIFITMVMMILISVLSIAMPVAANYLVPFYATNSAASLNTFLREVGQLQQEVDRETSATGSTRGNTTAANGSVVKSASASAVSSGNSANSASASFDEV